MILNTVALLVLLAAIFVLFNEELQSFAKKIIKNNTCRLVFPLLFASYIIMLFEDKVTYFLISLRILLFSYIYGLTKLIPASMSIGGAALEKIILLIFIITFILILGKLISKVKFCKQYSIYKYAMHISAILWLILSLLMVMVL